jgi:hypothetical protein
MMKTVIIEAVGWTSTAMFLLSILLPQRKHLHSLGVMNSINFSIQPFGREQ